MLYNASLYFFAITILTGCASSSMTHPTNVITENNQGINKPIPVQSINSTPQNKSLNGAPCGEEVDLYSEKVEKHKRIADKCLISDVDSKACKEWFSQDTKLAYMLQWTRQCLETNNSPTETRLKYSKSLREHVNTSKVVIDHTRISTMKKM